MRDGDVDDGERAIRQNRHNVPTVEALGSQRLVSLAHMPV